jgi:hypothetical protein
MKYSKPEISLLNSATAAIQGQLPKQGSTLDGQMSPPAPGIHVTVAAYEADE